MRYEQSSKTRVNLGALVKYTFHMASVWHRAYLQLFAAATDVIAPWS